jgi:uncharacterized membrane protein (UPF0182 family)
VPPGQAPPPQAQADAAPPAANAPEVPVAVAPPAPSGAVTLTPSKSAALQDVQTALDAVRKAQRDGNFADYGEALQRLDDAMNKYSSVQ